MKNKGKKLYISGKVSDVSKDKEKENAETFFKWHAVLTELGYNAHNPLEGQELGLTWEEYLAGDLLWMVENKPDIFLMKNWKESRGARLEYEMAKILNAKIIHEDEI